MGCKVNLCASAQNTDFADTPAAELVFLLFLPRYVEVLNMKNNPFLPFWLLSLSVVFGLTLPILIQEGMFQDAMLYSSVSHNLSIGYGSFWFPQYSTLNVFGLPSFHEHPPLAFGIQSLFYRLLGDSMYVERFYTFLMIVTSVVLINQIWRETYRDNPAMKRMGWLAVAMWMIIPICFWSYHHNMQENTMGIFLLGAVLLGLKAMHTVRYRYLLLALSGFSVFLATMCKGIPGFFPVTLPFCYWLATGKINWKDGIRYAALVALVPVCTYAVLLQFPASRDSLSTYFYQRVLNRIDALPTAQYQLQILWRLFTELLSPIALTLLLTGIARVRKAPVDFPERRQTALFFFLIGLAGSAPLALTMCQRGWYLVPSLPYFAIALAGLAAPAVVGPIARLDTKSLKYRLLLVVSGLALAFVLIYTALQKGKINRYQDIIPDIYEIGKVVPRFSTLTVPAEMYDQYDFILQGYLVRYFNISISPYKEYEYYLKEKKRDIPVPEQYKKVDIPTTKYELYRREPDSAR